MQETQSTHLPAGAIPLAELDRQMRHARTLRARYLATLTHRAVAKLGAMLHRDQDLPAAPVVSH